MMNSLITSHIANNTYTNNNQHVVASRSAIVNHNNFGMPTEVVPPVDNMDMMQGYLMDDTDAMRLVQGQQHMPNVVPNQRRHAVKFWTTDEHRSLINFCIIHLESLSHIYIFVQCY